MTDTEQQTTPDAPGQAPGIETPAQAAGSAGAAAPVGAAEAAATAEAVPPSPPEPAPEEQLAQLREENNRLRDQLLRALAETENVRRRAERDREDTAKFAISRFAKDLLEVADNLSRALAAVPASQLEGNEAANQLAVGVGLTEKQLQAAFERHGIQKVEPLDQKFDPHYHQAVFEVPETGKLPGTVVQVVQPGYVVNGRLLRPAMVGVAKGEPPQKVDTLA